MADNVAVSEGSGKSIRTDDVGGHQVQCIKLMAGGDGAAAFMFAGDYETVAASQTDQTLGPTGATGDYLAGVLIIPRTTSPGTVSVKDGAGSAIPIFNPTGAASAVTALVPFYVPLGWISSSGAWKLTTGDNVQAIGVGDFT